MAVPRTKACGLVSGGMTDTSAGNAVYGELPNAGLRAGLDRNDADDEDDAGFVFLKKNDEGRWVGLGRIGGRFVWRRQRFAIQASDKS